MSNFKPSIFIITRETQREARDSYGKKNAHRSVVFVTYRELKKHIKQVLLENLEDTVSVSRSKRGEWGEWFEHWMLIDGKPKIVKEGWN
jgi:hypothetical protein